MFYYKYGLLGTQTFTFQIFSDFKVWYDVQYLKSNNCGNNIKVLKTHVDIDDKINSINMI